MKTAVFLCAPIAMMLVGTGCGGGSGGSPTVSTTRSPIKHVIVVIGENRSFDNVFATYVPSDPSQSVRNLLAEGIVTQEGQPGRNFPLAVPNQATDTVTYEISPVQTGPFDTLPQPNTATALPVGECVLTSILYPATPLCSDVGLDPTSQGLLSVPGSGQLPILADCRYPSDLPAGPFSIVGASRLNDCLPPVLVDQITTTSYLNNTGDPVHRFFQMWQQADCSRASATSANPSGCEADLFPWVGTTVGAAILPPPLTFQGGVSMGFYNMAQGDFPLLQSLAGDFAINDNYHQPVMGGTGPNSQFLLTGDMYYFTNPDGSPGVPSPGLIENPNPLAGTNNFYINDALGLQDPGSTGVGFTNCSDTTQPGVASIQSYLSSLPYTPFGNGNCATGVYYQVNNDYPYYTTTGSVISPGDTREFPAGPTYSIGPQTLPTIGDELAAHKIAWKYYGEGFKQAASPPPFNSLYCAICNAFQYSTSIMTGPLRANLADLDDFYNDLTANNLPAVSFVKPDTLLDGHPASSTGPLFEAFLDKLISSVQAEPSMWKNTAILITFDESGGEYDTGYIEPIDFFGDGPRTVMIAVSNFAKRGFVDHTYADHASILKFIEWNWRLKPLSNRSRDNLPNPTTDGDSLYVPSNPPAIGDLTGMFDFAHPRSRTATAQ